jgi:ribosomal protein S12 methylthiotransferase accessory factor
MLDLPPGHDPGPLRPLLSWVDDRFGPIRRLEARLLPETRWWLYAGDLSRTPPGTWYRPYPAAAAGASIDPGEALRRALGEAVERYSGLTPPEDDQCFPLRARESELLGRFPLCAPDEPCPPVLRKRDPDATITHARASRLADGRAVAVPAACIYQTLVGEAPLVEPVSSGLAFHTELHRAIWGGLCEVAERDAVLLAWWAQRPLSPIACAGEVPDALAERLERLRYARLRPHLFDATSDFRVPTVLALLFADAPPFAAAGAACTVDPLAACTKALDEAVYIRACFDGGEAFSLPPEDDDFPRPERLEDHGRLYASWEQSPAFAFLLEGGAAPVSFADFAGVSFWRAPESMEDLSDLARSLEAQGLTALWADVTVPEALGVGRVVKVIVPEMVPLPHAHGARWLATPRLLRFAGVSEATLDAFNPFPQPLA